MMETRRNNPSQFEKKKKKHWNKRKVSDQICRIGNKVRAIRVTHC